MKQESDQLLEFDTSSPEETIHLGEQLGRFLAGGEIIELTSDIGGGKTTFAKGVIRGTGCQSPVTSPTFTVAKEYQGASLHIFHYDFYRLQEPGVVGQELSEVLEDKTNVVIIEWSAVAKKLFEDKPVLRVRLTSDKQSDSMRHIVVTVPADYLLIRDQMGKLS